ncbi:hypothetical protein MmiAt1_11820 [Methanimicrococcus sp. At1]|uniref:Secreted protein n=1 Tax=Methanimicrococcus hacksteinii TaxID=3028293 RepID=A0ABU3VQA3_9EURY|nr:hypothetical protein [Methanimicrococcus sp. At1]MDV0445597.1 hypothetical protein [Methanimicrococcus sp. At1]
MYRLIFSTAARYASVGTDYLTVSVCAVTLLFPFCCYLTVSVRRCYLTVSACRCRLIRNTVADLPACTCACACACVPVPPRASRSNFSENSLKLQFLFTDISNCKPNFF